MNKMTGTWIPDELMKLGEAKGLTLRQIVLLSRIMSLDNDKGCFATNAWLAEKMNCDRSMITKMVNTLSKKGLIQVTITQKGMMKERVIRVVNPFTTVVNPFTTDGEHIHKGGEPIPHIEYSKENNRDNKGVSVFQKFLLAFQVQQNANLSTAWVKLSDQDKKLIEDHLPEYIKRTAPKGAAGSLTWRKSPLNYLKGREWLNPLPVVQDQTLIDPTVLPAEKRGGLVVPSNGVRYK